MSRREFLEKAAQITSATLGVYGLYELAKETKRRTIENAPEGIYYILTGEKVDLKGITDKNYEEVLKNLKVLLEEPLKSKGEIKKFNNIDEGINSLISQKGTVILVLWPTKEYPPTIEPSLGILEKAGVNYIKAWDPNRGEIEYKETLNVWRKNKYPLVYLIFDKKIQISEEKKQEIERLIKKSRQRP